MIHCYVVQRSILYFVELSVFVFCGTISFCILWNNPFVENDPYPSFASLTDPPTSFLRIIDICSPYPDEVNENWPFLKNNFDEVQYKLIVEKKVIGNNLTNAIVDIHAHQCDVIGMSTPDLLPGMIRKNKDVKKLIKSVKSRKLRVMRETFAERLDAV
jgi:hypothetical protein